MKGFARIQKDIAGIQQKSDVFKGGARQCAKPNSRGSLKSFDGNQAEA